MKKKYFILYLVFLSQLFYTQIFSKNLTPYKEFSEKTIKSLSPIKDSSALKTQLKNVARLAKTTKEEQSLEIISLVLLAECKTNDYDKINKKAIIDFEKAIQLSQENKLTNLEIYATITYAYYLYHYREMERSLPLFLQASTMLENSKLDEVILLADTYKKLGFFFTTVGELNDAIIYLQKAQKYAEPKSSELAAILDNIGVIYIQLKQRTHAISYFNEALQISKLINDEVREAKVLGNMALLNKKEGKFDVAIQQLQKDIQLSKKNKSDQNTMYALILLSQVYLEKNDAENSKKALLEAETYAHSKSYLKSSEMQITEILLRIAEKTGDTQNELALRKKIDVLNENLKNTDGAQQIKQVNFAAQKEKINTKLALKQKKLEQEKTKKNTSILIIGILMIAIIVGIVVFNKKRKKESIVFNEKICQLQDERITSEQKLESTSKTLEDYTSYLNEKKSQIQDLENELEQLRSSSPSSFKNQKKELSTLLQSHLMTEENWLNFKRTFIEEQPEYYQYLISNFSALTDSNLRLLMLMKLGLGTKEISNIQGITQDAVKKAKQRLKKKYGAQFDLILLN